MSIVNSAEFICKTTPSYLIIHTDFYEHNGLLIKYLFEKNYSFHTYQQYDLRSIWVVIRNLDPSAYGENMSSSLSKLGREVSHDHDIKLFSDKPYLPLLRHPKKSHRKTQIYTKPNIYCTSKWLSKNLIRVNYHCTAIAVCLMDTLGVGAITFHDVSDMRKNSSNQRHLNLRPGVQYGSQPSHE
jgi:hypothetical protein